MVYIDIHEYEYAYAHEHENHKNDFGWKTFEAFDLKKGRP